MSRGRAYALPLVAAALIALAGVPGAGAQTRLMTYQGQWAEAVEAALLDEETAPALSIVPYDGALASLQESDADILDAETDAANFICDQGPALPMPPAFWVQRAEDTALLPGTEHDCGTGYLVTSLLLASTTGGPHDWQQFFDAQAYAGGRALPRGARGTLEIALMAAGAALPDIYKLLATQDGTAQAFEALDRLAADTKIMFWDIPADAMALVRSGAVAAAAMPNVHAAMLAGEMDGGEDAQSSGEVISLHFDGQLYRFQRLVLLAGAAGQADALGIMARILSPAVQARLAGLLLAGPVNADAFLQLPKQRAALLPTAPVHRIHDTGLEEDADFWATHGARLDLRFHEWLAAHEGAGR